MCGGSSSDTLALLLACGSPATAQPDTRLEFTWFCLSSGMGSSSWGFSRRSRAARLREIAGGRAWLAAGLPGLCPAAAGAQLFEV
jgi:hypothetical protein